MRVTIQYRETRKPYNWKNAFPARVKYADRELTLVKGCGSHSSFYTNGEMRGLGYKPSHPHAKNLPKRPGRWRLHPASVAALKAAVKEGAGRFVPKR